MNKVREALKPCPFCGGAANIMGSGYGNNTVWSAFCDGEKACNAAIQHLSEAAAIAAWNRRSPESAVGEERERCAKVVDDYRAKYGGDWPALEAVAAAIRAPVESGEAG